MPNMNLESTFSSSAIHAVPEYSINLLSWLVCSYPHNTPIFHTALCYMQ